MIAVHRASGGAAINETVTVPTGQYKQLVSVTAHLSAAPTTSEYFTIALDSAEGAEYDTVLYKVNPSTTSMTDLFWQPDLPYYVAPGDAVDVTFTNTDARTYGLTITVRGA